MSRSPHLALHGGPPKVRLHQQHEVERVQPVEPNGLVLWDFSIPGWVALGLASRAWLPCPVQVDAGSALRLTVELDMFGQLCWIGGGANGRNRFAGAWRRRGEGPKDRPLRVQQLRPAAFWDRVSAVPQPVKELVGYGIGFVLMGAVFLGMTPGPPPAEAALGHAEGRISDVEIEYDRGRSGTIKIPESATFHLDDGSDRRYYLSAPGPFEDLADELVYAEASIFEPVVRVSYETVDSGGDHQVFDLRVGDRTLVEYSEIAGARRDDARLLPRFALFFFVAGIVLLARAYKRRDEKPVEWRPKSPFTKARRTYGRLRLHRVFGPVDRWFN